MKNFIQWVYSFLRTPSAMEIALVELEDAKRQLLHAQTATEYSARMAMYHGDRIKRLTAYVQPKASEE